MHTDEYEISLGREIALCRKMVRRLKESLKRREKQGGMTTEAFLQTFAGAGLAEQPSINIWNQEYQELKMWVKRLAEYEEALEGLKSL
jgi:hypothetical protein